MSRLAHRKPKRMPKTRSTERRTVPRRPRRVPGSGGVESIMLKISRERVNQLARELLDAMTRTQSVMLLKDREVVRQSIAHALGDEFKREEEREENVRRKLAMMKKGPAPGTREWEQLFRKLMEEEYLREGLDS